MGEANGQATPRRREASGQATPRRLRVAIAGATGFLGRALAASLQDEHEIIGLTRSDAPDRDDGVEWRQADLFSVREVEAALSGADVAIYLVHSMQPTARLTQASFSDLDLMLADNFARAAKAAGVGHVVYVGGFVPEDEALSAHLESRQEVEQTLRARGPALTALRTGIIVGRGSSSLWILVNLVRRLPFMVLPSWTASRTQPIALADLLRAIRHLLRDPERWVGSFDLGGPEVLTYASMMRRTARELGLRRFMLQLRVLSPRFSRLWVALFGSAPFALVGPLIESLRHPMVAKPNPLQEWLAPESLPFDRALADAVAPGARPVRPPSSLRLTPTRRDELKRARAVRSVQRLPLPPGRDAAWAADEYLRFLPRFARPLIRVEPGPGGRCVFRLAGTRTVLLEMHHATERSEPDRQVFEVTGGVLARVDAESPGRLEFRETADGRSILAAIHDFRPALPWWIYEQSQARVHLQVMRGFGRHLARSASSARAVADA